MTRFTLTRLALMLTCLIAGGLRGQSINWAAGVTYQYDPGGNAIATDIANTGRFRAASNGTEFKGFFFSEADAQSFAKRMTQLTGQQHTVVSAEAAETLIRRSPPHRAATEGAGVLIPNEDLKDVPWRP